METAEKQGSTGQGWPVHRQPGSQGSPTFHAILTMPIEVVIGIPSDEGVRSVIVYRYTGPVLQVLHALDFLWSIGKDKLHFAIVRKSIIFEGLIQIFLPKNDPQVMDGTGVELHSEDDVSSRAPELLMVTLQQDVSFQEQPWFNGDTDAGLAVSRDVVNARCVHRLHGLVDAKKGPAPSFRLKVGDAVHDHMMQKQRLVVHFDGAGE